MSGLFQILLVLSVFAVGGAAIEIGRRQKEVKRLRDEHGDAYDEVRKRWE